MKNGARENCNFGIKVPLPHKYTHFDLYSKVSIDYFINGQSRLPAFQSPLKIKS